MSNEKKQTDLMIDPSDLQLDIHTHTLASGHAYGTIR